MPNMGNIINSHNTRLLRGNNKEDKMCNCRDKNACPMDGHCLTQNSIYQATVITNQSQKEYIGTCEGSFKERYNNHTKSFRNRRYERDTELSKHIWAIKDKGDKPQITWSIATRTRPYAGGSRNCDLCTSEKLLIATKQSGNLLNKRSELISKCRHQNKYLLKNFKSRIRKNRNTFQTD